MCVLSSFTLRQFSQSARKTFFDIVRKFGIEREFYVVLLDASGSVSTLSLIWVEDKVTVQARLGRCGLHGEWLKWTQGFQRVQETPS